MQKAMLNRNKGIFEFQSVPLDELYYKSQNGAVVEVTVTADLQRICFAHRGHPDYRVPQTDAWTVSDVETGLAVGTGDTARGAIEDANEKAQSYGPEWVATSALAFIAQYGRTEGIEQPVIRVGSPIFWREPQTCELKWGRVKMKVTGLTGRVIGFVVNNARVVDASDIHYVWPRRIDLGLE